MLAEQLQRGISIALIFCGPRGEPISFDDYRSFITTLPQALSTRMPLPDNPACVRWGYGDRVAGGDTPCSVRYAAVTPDDSFIVAVHYKAAAFKGGLPKAGYSPYRVREFQSATLEAIKAVPDIAGRSANSDFSKTIDFIFDRLSLAFIPYFALALWIVWYATEFSYLDILFIGAEAIGILIVFGLVATVFIFWSKRRYFYPIAVAGASIVLVLMNKVEILNSYEASRFMSEMVATTRSNYRETISRSETSIGRALYDMEKSLGRRLQELFGEFGETGLDDALVPATLQDATKRHSLASVVRLRQERAKAADQKLDLIFQLAHEEMSAAVAGFLPRQKADIMHEYENGSSESKALYKEGAVLYAAMFDDLLELYAILDEHEHAVDGKGVVIFNDGNAVERYNNKLREIDEVFTKMKDIVKALDGPPV
jgi:hypothetical protein